MAMIYRLAACFFASITAVAMAPAADAQFSRHMVFFTNKQGGNFTVANPSAYLSARARLRRTTQGIAIDSTDLPVVSRYVDSVRSVSGVAILSQSKWLNGVLIVCSDSAALQRIRSFPFVKMSSAAALRTAAAQAREKFPQGTALIAELQSRSMQAQQDSINYGQNRVQIDMHNAQWLHRQGLRGQGIHIAVHDAGFEGYLSTPVLDSARLQNRILSIRDFVDFDGSVNEDNSHGRECLTVMGANRPGLMVGSAPQASFHLLRTENAASEQPIEMFNWVVGAEYADSVGSDIISSSLGYYSFDDSRFDYSYANFYNNSTLVTQGATLAARKGMLVMNSAGNEGQVGWRHIVFPADADSVCAVGAVTANRNIASFSSIGFPGKIKPNVVSMGLNTVVAGPQGLYTNSGTSFSNPNMAGMAACLWQAFPRVKNVDIIDALQRSADRFTNPNDRFGYGIPNMRTAWQFLKKKENDALFGTDWLQANPRQFTDTLRVRYVAQNDGVATLRLVHESGQEVRNWKKQVEAQFVYDTLITSLNTAPLGRYVLTYQDTATTKSVTLEKPLSAALKDQPLALPNPFTQILRIYSPRNAATRISELQIVDATGRPVFQYSEGAFAGFPTPFIEVTSAALWPSGMYFARCLLYNGAFVTLPIRKQ